MPSHFSAETTYAAQGARLVTKADAALPNGACKALLCDQPGTANLLLLDGTLATNFPLQQGYNPIMVQAVRLGGSAPTLAEVQAFCEVAEVEVT